MTPLFGIVNPIGSLFYVSGRSAEKIGLSLSYLVSEKKLI